MNRQAIINRRAQLTPQQQQAAGDAIAQRLFKTIQYQQAQQLGAYLPINGECATQQIMQHAWATNKQIYLPVISQAKHQPAMDFVHYQPDSPCRTNRYGILEPLGEQHISATELDLVLTPLVHFDQAKHRIGMGGGYYDRTFAFRQVQIPPPWLIGLAYDFQQLDAISPEPWDVACDLIITQEQLIP